MWMRTQKGGGARAVAVVSDAENEVRWVEGGGGRRNEGLNRGTVRA